MTYDLIIIGGGPAGAAAAVYAARKRLKTLLIVAHRLSTVEHCDRLFRLEKGRVVEEGETAVVLGKDASSVK